MFDLNMDIEPSNQAHNDKEPHPSAMKAELDPQEEASGTNTELSGTSSNSSIVNVDESPISGEYDFFRRRENSSPFVTRQLLPIDVEADGGERVGVERDSDLELLRFGSSPASSQASHNQWLNLSVSGSGSGLGVGPDAPNQGNNKQQVRRSRRGPRSRSSQYRGVTFYRRTGRWESHIWDCGKQVYLGGFDTAHAAARAYDRAAIKFRGVDADINFNFTDFDEDMKQMKNLTKEEFVHILRRQSTGFSRGSSRYRGVTLHKCGRWEARMGQFLGKKAYDKAAIQCNGRDAVTNLEPSSYEGQIQMQANNGGGGAQDDLDLNLGISVAIDGPKASNHLGVGGSQAHHSRLQLANGKLPMNGATAGYNPAGGPPLYGQPLASRQSNPMWSGLLPGRSGTYEEKASDPSTGRVPNWAWYMQSQGQGGGGGGGGGTRSQVQGLFSSAASSGFSLSATAANSSSAATFPNFPNPQANQAIVINHSHQLPPTPPPGNSFPAYALDR